MARTRQGHTRGRLGFGRRSGRTTPAMGAVEFFTRPEQNIIWQVLGFIVRARAELTVLTVLVVASVVLREEIGSDAAFYVLTATTCVVFAVPASRRYLIRRAWCVTTRHRMRSCFAQTRTMTHDGRMPFLVWSRPSPVGERVRVWLPAGLSVKDLERVTAELATACWAREVRITGSRSQAAYVLVEVVRRDPLGSNLVLTPDVIDDVDTDVDDEIDGTVVPLPDRASLAPVPTAEPATTSGPRPARKTPTTVPARTTNGASSNDASDLDDPVTGFGGVDVSDYV
ncbi:hypothetical protein [Pseudonocardia alaniniphila]|uniref:Uncharacterized protein n=1 Tax=Pseudonocardia alaniniphila TaxID=75291 RepID=A0ABS9TRT4_9PSEU|nr:hypothetical protein [Pseudonocardia alaniniphila]MCH6171273.1 hypothetical protein [Pseudonocardia alaniniphila]